MFCDNFGTVMIITATFTQFRQYQGASTEAPTLCTLGAGAGFSARPYFMSDLISQIEAHAIRGDSLGRDLGHEPYLQPAATHDP